METSQDILVAILAAALAVLLVLTIVVAALAIRILRAINRITDKAEHVIETAEHVGQAFSNATGSLAVVRLVRNVVAMAQRAANRKDTNSKRGS